MGTQFPVMVVKPLSHHSYYGHNLNRVVRELTLPRNSESRKYTRSLGLLYIVQPPQKIGVCGCLCLYWEMEEKDNTIQYAWFGNEQDPHVFEKTDGYVVENELEPFVGRYNPCNPRRKTVNLKSTIILDQECRTGYIALTHCIPEKTSHT